MWWRRRKVQPERISPAVLNFALRVKLSGHAPVRQPLARQHPELTGAELDQCVAITESAYRRLGELFDSVSKRSHDVAHDNEVFHRFARAEIPWLSEHNSSRFFSQCVWSLLK
jgi:hypothetical protein